MIKYVFSKECITLFIHMQDLTELDVAEEL